MEYTETPYMMYASMEIPWLPMDTEELYKKNLKLKKRLLEKYNWINSTVTYKFNRHGFRCQDFNDNSSILFLGASVVIGIGLPIENVWTSIVAKSIGLDHYNFGIGGASNDTSFRLAYAWLDKLKPKIVVNLQTFNHRIEIFDVQKFGNDQHLESGSFESEWALSEKNGHLNKIKNNLAIAKLCQNLDIKYLALDAQAMEPYVDYARDLYHPGIATNQKFADTVLSML